jgi:hypothetical protein
MSITDWDESDLPRFIIGDSVDRTFIVHLHFPRFIGEVIGNNISPKFIDQPDTEDVLVMAKLMRDAGDFYVAELEREEL